MLVFVFTCGYAMRIGCSFCQCVFVSLIRSLPHHCSPCRLSSQANSFNIATAIDPTYHRRQNQRDDMHAATQMKTVVPVSRSLPLAGKLCSLQETWWMAVSVVLPVNRIKLPVGTLTWRLKKGICNPVWQLGVVTWNLVWKPDNVICTVLTWRLEEGTCNPVWQPGVVAFYFA